MQVRLEVAQAAISSTRAPRRCTWVCWESSQSPARCIQAKPRCTHQLRVDRQWLTACCDMGRAASGQAAVCASGCGGEREWHLARESGVAEAPGEGRGDGRERSQPLHPSAAVAIAPASTLLTDRRCRRKASHFPERCRSAVPARRAGRLQRRTAGTVRCARPQSLSVACTHRRARSLPNSVTCKSDRFVMICFNHSHN